MNLNNQTLTKGVTLVNPVDNATVTLVKNGPKGWLTDNSQYRFIRSSDIDGWQLIETEKQPNLNGDIDPTELEKDQTIIHNNLEWQLENIDYALDGSARLNLTRGDETKWAEAKDCGLSTAKQSPQPKPQPQKPKQPLLKLTPPGQPAKPKMDNSPTVPTYVYVIDNKTLDLHLESFFGQPAIAIDTETTGLDPHRDRIRLLQIAAENCPVLVIDFFKISESKKLRQLLQHEKITKIAHNMKFDWQFLYKAGYEVKRLFCTDIAEQLLKAGLRPNHKLKDLCEKYLKIDLSKAEQKSDWSAATLTSEQLEYAAIDADVLLDLYHILKPKIIDAGLGKIAGIEFKAIPAVAEIELNGMRLDLDRWGQWVKGLEAEYKERSDHLSAQLKSGDAQLSLLPEYDTIDLDSHAQVLKSLKSLGIPVINTKNQTITPLASKYPILQEILAYRKVSKALNSFGKKMPEHINPATGRIHSNYWQMGAASGRFANSDPNLQQTPRDKVVRSCFIPEPGYKYVIADYSQIELRIAAEISNDTKMIDAYVEGKDLHKLTASMVLAKPIEDITKEERQLAKATNFGLIYGQSAPGYKAYAEGSYGVKISLADAEKFRDNFFKAYAGISRWHKGISRECYRRNNQNKPSYTRTLTGRRRMFYPDKAYLNPLANTPVQGTGADMIKRALGLLRDALKGTGAKIIGCIHDEIILECPSETAEKAAQLLSKTMEQAGNEILTKVPCVAEASIGDSWADK